MPSNPDPDRRQRLATLAVILVLVAGGAWAWYRSLDRNPPSVPTGPEPAGMPGSNLGVEELRAKKLPEYAELKGFVRPDGARLSRAEVARAVELCGHPNVMVRIRAIGTVSRAGTPDRAVAVAAVAAHLRDDHLHVRLQAMNVLVSMDARECVPDILRLADSDNEDERRAAKRVLRQLGHPGE